MIGILFATKTEAQPFLDRKQPEGTVTVISGMGLEAARIAAEKLVEQGCSLIINAGACGALNNRLKREAVYRISMVSIEDLKTAVQVGIGTGLKRLVSVEQPVFTPERKKTLMQHGELVDMEGYAVARVCEAHRIPCVLLKGVTDFSDAHGKKDIQEHIAAVSERLAATVLRCLEKPHPRSNTGALSLWKKIRSFTKMEHIIFSLPLLLSGAWIGAKGMPPLKTMLLIALAGTGARTFGMAINRILDRDIDAENPRTKNRELPAGTLSMTQGYAVLGAGLLLYFSACFLLGALMWKLSILPLVPLGFYSLLKRFTPLCHYGIGICLALAPPAAFIAVTGSLAIPSSVLLLALFAFGWISGFDIIYALMDIDFDRARNVNSLPAALGPLGAQFVAALTHLVAFAALVAIWSVSGGVFSFLSMLVAFAAFGAAYMSILPLPFRFFPLSAIAGIAGALVVLFGVYE